MIKQNAHKTAMHRKQISKPLKHLLKWLADNPEQPNTTRLDYGCGRGVDLINGAVGYDPYFQPVKPKRTFDIVTCFYVLNVVDRETRGIIMKDLIEYSDNLISIAVRTDKINGKTHEDGVITAKGTFQKSFTHQELLELLPDCLEILHQEKGFVIVRKNRKLKEAEGG